MLTTSTTADASSGRTSIFIHKLSSFKKLHTYTAGIKSICKQNLVSLAKIKPSFDGKEMSEAELAYM